MVHSCQEKYEIYENFMLRHQIEFDEVPWTIEVNGTIFSRHTLNGHDEINEIAQRIDFFDKKIRCLLLLLIPSLFFFFLFCRQIEHFFSTEGRFFGTNKSFFR